MQTRPSHRGDLSHDSTGNSAHPKPVTPSSIVTSAGPRPDGLGPIRSIDPAARTAKRAYNVLSASSVGLELGISVLIGLFVGTAMDRWLGTTPWFLLLWIGFGFAAGFRGVMRAVKRADRAAAAEEAEANGLS
jgi:ATP synthase protein I